MKPKEILDDIPYTESLHHYIKADVVYITYNPLSWFNFKTSTPRIAGIHAHAYWLPPHPNYGILPNIANIVNRFTSYFELRRFNAIHTVTNIYPINHPNVHYIPNYVDSKKFIPCKKDQDFSVTFISRNVWQKGWDILKKVKNLINPKILFNISYGQVPENNLPFFIGKNHVTIIPSRVDTFGLSIVESMMCETPVITTPLSTHKALELPTLYATYPEEFVEKIYTVKNLWQTKKEYNELSRLCRISALRFDKKRIIDKLENMFKEVVKNS
jgi:glycosyltransferase involved in cell wall biosynthesis